jgi:beta-lactam-binding protein with PASTA domain
MAFNFDLEGLEDSMGNNLRLFIGLTIGLLVFVGLIALSVFFIALRGKEEVMVPDVIGKELPLALVELQEKELYPRISMRLATAGEEKGVILEQSPDPGTLVKAERRINLVISHGTAFNAMENYAGKNINDVRSAIRLFNAQSPEVSIILKEPFMYQYSEIPAGTIIQQTPPPGTDLTGNVRLELVVSRGQETTRITVPNLTGLSFADALARLNQIRASFVFTMRPADEGEKPGAIYSQNPQQGAELEPTDKIKVGVTTPAASEGEGVGLFTHVFPANPYPLPISVEVEYPNKNRQTLVSTNHSGGEFSMPYKLPAGSVLILSMVDREVARTTVTASTAGKP